MADRRLTQQSISEYADLTTDRNPLHVDEAFASKSRFSGLIAHGFLLLGGPLTEIPRSFEYPVTLRCRFVSPGRPGDLLITEVDDSVRTSQAFEVKTSDGELRLTGSIMGDPPSPSKNVGTRSS